MNYIKQIPGSNRPPLFINSAANTRSMLPPVFDNNVTTCNTRFMKTLSFHGRHSDIINSSQNYTAQGWNCIAFVSLCI